MIGTLNRTFTNCLKLILITNEERSRYFYKTKNTNKKWEEKNEINQKNKQKSENYWNLFNNVISDNWLCK